MDGILITQNFKAEHYCYLSRQECPINEFRKTYNQIVAFFLENATELVGFVRKLKIRAQFENLDVFFEKKLNL